MGRKLEELYDPVVVVDGKGELAGTITMRQVIKRAFDMEIKIASCSNPLTSLPGNTVDRLLAGGSSVQEELLHPVFRS